MTADSAQARRPRLQFSLREMLLVMLVGTIAVWIASWQEWDADERMLLGFWVVAVSAAITRSRLRGQRGVWLTASAGGAAALAGYATYWLWLAVGLLRETSADRHLIGSAAIAAIAGFVSGALAAAAFTPAGIEELPPSQREDRLRRRLPQFVGAILAFVLLIGAYGAYERGTRWEGRPADWLFGWPSGRTISLDGSRWAAYGRRRPTSDYEPILLQLADPRDSQQKPILLEFDSAVESIAFSPRGSELAVVLDANPIQLLLLDSMNGSELKRLSVAFPPGNAEFAPSVKFSPDGKRLMLLTLHGSEEQLMTTIREWSVADWTQVGERDFEGPCFLHASRETLRLVLVSESERRQLTPPTAMPVAVAVLDESGNVIGSFDPCLDHFQIRFSPRGDRFLCYGQLYDLATGEIKSLPARLVAFTPDGDRVIGVEGYSSRLLNGGPIRALPILRHVFERESRSRLVVFDARTGEQTFSSRWTEGLTSDMLLPDDCSFAVAGGIYSGYCVWELPDAAR